MAFLLVPSALPFHKPLKKSPLLRPKSSLIPNAPSFKTWVSGFQSKSLNFAFSGALALGLSLTGLGFADAKVGVNKPELLPKEFTPVIDVAGFLSAGQENRLMQEIAYLEKDTGYKLRVLAQNYPDTPGLAVRDFWQVDDRTIVFVADPTFGNILNFNVGASVDLDVPRSFWSRLAGKYGNIFYWKEKVIGFNSLTFATLPTVGTDPAAVKISELLSPFVQTENMIVLWISLCEGSYRSSALLIKQLIVDFTKSFLELKKSI